MRYAVNGRYDRHRRDFMVEGETFAQAKRIALELAKFYAEHGSGTYGPLVWRKGEITLVSETNDVTVIRRLRPDYLQLVVSPDDESSND
jgi:hypothetical protein